MRKAESAEAVGCVHTLKSRVRDLLPDALIAVRMYKASHGRYPNILDPSTFTEKVVFRKIFDRRPILAKLQDKLSVRDYVAQRLGGEVLPTLHVATDRPETIPFDSLPDMFVVKPSHASGLVAIVTGRRSIDRAGMIKQCRAWLRCDYYRQTREWAYKNIRRQIMVEEFIGDSAGGTPNDYKFYVFHGAARLIQVHVDRFTRHRQGFFDPDWQRLDVALPLQYDPIIGSVARPKHLEDMIEAAERLGEGMDFIRVDLYDTDRRFYFGEITIYPGSGLHRYRPVEFDQWLGAFWYPAGAH